jgi:hypothetical protein
MTFAFLPRNRGGGLRRGIERSAQKLSQRLISLRLRLNDLNVLNCNSKRQKARGKNHARNVRGLVALPILGRVLELLDAADAEVGVNAGRRAE